MDLMQSLRNQRRVNWKKLGLIAVPFLVFGCATTSTSAPQVDGDKPAVQQAEVDDKGTDKATETLPVSPELMYYILTAEVAGQRGEIGAAVDLYQRAAALSNSPALASRSAQVATLTRNQQKIDKALARWQEVEPNNPDIYIMQVPLFMLKQDYDGVVTALNNALALTPEREKRQEYMARTVENLADVAPPEQAMATIKRLDAYQAGDAAVHYAYARLAFFYQQNDIAYSEVESLLADDGDNEDYLILKADLLQRQGKPEEGVALIEDLAQQADASTQVRFAYGKLLGDSGQTEKARDVFEALHMEDAENHDVLFALGLLALEDGNGQQAKSYFTDLLKLGGTTPQVAYFMGLAEELENNIDAALSWFASVPVHSSRFDMAQSQYLRLLLSRGEVAKARLHLAGLRQDMPEQATRYYLIEAGILRDYDQPQAAFDMLSEALRRYPTSPELRYSRAMIAESLDKLDVLEQDLRAILQQDPDNAQALNALGYTLTDRTDRHQEALQMINRALELEPGDPFYLDSLGWVYYRLGDLEKAEKYLREAVAQQPDAEFIAHLGEVLWVRGKQGEAERVWQEGLQQDGDNDLLQETMRRLKQ